MGRMGTAPVLDAPQNQFPNWVRLGYIRSERTITDKDDGALADADRYDPSG